MRKAGVLPFPVAVERRKHPRAPLLVRVECRSPAIYVLGTCENISENGLLVRTPQPFEPGHRVTVRFLLPPVQTGTAIQASGVVQRVNPGESMALEFVGLKARERRAIAQYVERTSRD